MPCEIVTIPCLADNYAYLVHDRESGETAVVDVPESAPLGAALEERGWTLTQVWLTHHHWDHVDGLDELLKDHPASVIGARADTHRLPELNVAVGDGDTLEFGGEMVRVMDVSGHTVGHIAFYMPDTGAVFTADSLMALGCGRLFEGDPAMMWQSLSKLAALPPETVVCSGHEYTQANGRFALTVNPGNPDLQARIAAVDAARAAGRPTVPTTLAEEQATNPFLRGDDPDIQKTVGMEGGDAGAVFAEVRRLKDAF